MGHIGFGEYFDKFIHAFHMPMFFIVSGMFFGIKDPFDVFLGKKAKSLLLPYAVFGLFHYGIWIILNWSEVNAEPLLHLLFINTDGLPIAGALWFLTALFFAEIIYYLICRYITIRVAQHAIVVIISLFGCMATKILPFRLPYALDAAFVGVGLMHIGCLYKKYAEKLHRIEELKIYESIILGVIATVLIFINGYINMRNGVYSIIPLFWLNAVLATVVGINLAKWVVRVAPLWIRRYLSCVGRNSIVYLCLNQMVITCVKKVASVFDFPLIINRILIFILVLFALGISEKLIMNTRLCVLVGKFTNHINRE